MSAAPNAAGARPALPQVLAFDVFGTVVDWHGSVAREVAALLPEVDAAAFARDWRALYVPAMQRVARGELGWTRLDDLHRMNLDALLARHGITRLDEAQRAHLNRAWHRLDPWPDVVAGLTRLKGRRVICTLSNGNIALLTHMARYGGLPWDCILSAEVFRAYKPAAAAYLGVAEVFGLAPGQVMLVAAHHDDLAAARACGLQTAYIERPAEFGADRPKDVSPVADNTWHARDFLHLAEQFDRFEHS